MPKFIAAVIALILLAGCSHTIQSSELVETEPQLTTGCLQLAVLTETADADEVFEFIAARRMLGKLKERAMRLGATHIVWLHKTAHAATAQAYRCP